MGRLERNRKINRRLGEGPLEIAERVRKHFEHLKLLGQLGNCSCLICQEAERLMREEREQKQ